MNTDELYLNAVDLAWRLLMYHLNVGARQYAKPEQVRLEKHIRELLHAMRRDMNDFGGVE